MHPARARTRSLADLPDLAEKQRESSEFCLQPDVAADHQGLIWINEDGCVPVSNELVRLC